MSKQNNDPVFGLRAIRKDPIVPTVEAIESMQRNVDYWGQRTEKAEARVAELEAALKQIAESGWQCEDGSTLATAEAMIARAVLAKGRAA